PSGHQRGAGPSSLYFGFDCWVCLWPAGVCGYGETVATAPCSSMVAAVAPIRVPTEVPDKILCGACYKITCQGHPACSTDGVTVTVADVCRGGPCLEEANHVDLSGHAFGRMAQPGREDELPAAGTVSMIKGWVGCVYDSPPALVVHPSATGQDFKFTLLFAPGKGMANWLTLELKEALHPTDDWKRATWWEGASWKFTDDDNKPIPVQAPLSIKLTWSKLQPEDDITAETVIPAGWKPRDTYYFNSSITLF
ncbi:hypothetical protein EJB05_44088, partial [Eragrostis curvula]